MVTIGTRQMNALLSSSKMPTSEERPPHGSLHRQREEDHATLKRRNNQRELTLPKPHTHERKINVIIRGSEVSKITHLATKRHTQQTAKAQGQTNGVAEHQPTQIIIFSTFESTKLFNPHHDALVIALYIANCLAKCILIDNGSSANILFLSAFREMGIPESSITRKFTILIRFSGEHKSTIGEIVLLVYAEGVNLYTKFLVMDSSSAYNIIFGKLWIHEMEAIPSTYH